MARLAKFAAAGLAATALGFAVAACQPQMMAPRALDAAAPANAMTVAEVQELVVGKNYSHQRRESESEWGGIFFSGRNSEIEGKAGQHQYDI